MKRSHQRLARAAAGDIGAGSDDARDALFHFFQDAHHLKDWLRNDPEVDLLDDTIENAVSTSPVLAVCADLANGSKHLLLRRPRRPDAGGAAFVSQGVTVHVMDVSSAHDQVNVLLNGSAIEQPLVPSLVHLNPPTGYVEHSWLIAANGETLQAVELSDRVIAAWGEHLNRWGMLI
jgi:hypothetical protein